MTHFAKFSAPRSRLCSATLSADRSGWGNRPKRLDRLRANGDIKGFTVRLRDDVGEDQIRAFMLIELSGSPLKSTIAAIKRVPGFVSVFNTNGIGDMIAEVEVTTMLELNELISTVRSLDGVSKSETFIILGPA